MRRALLLIAAAVLLAPASAWAGGFATAGLSSTPAGLGAGEEWNVDITILQHGRTPMEGLTPAVVIELPNGVEQRFIGQATGKPGVYGASVVFPEDGTYGYHVDDGFTNAVPHTFRPVRIGAAAALAGSDGGGFPWWIVTAVCALAVTLLVLARARRRAASSEAPRSTPAAAPGPNG